MKILEGYRYQMEGHIIDSKECFEKDFVVEITSINKNENAFGFYKHLGYNEVKTILRK